MVKYRLVYTEADGMQHNNFFGPDAPWSHGVTEEITHVWEFKRKNHGEAKKHAEKLLKSERLFKRCKRTTVNVELMEILDFTVK